MKSLIIVYLLLLSLLFTKVCDAKDIDGKIIVDGMEREYILHLPKEYDVTIPLPLVMVFHGGGGDAKGMVKLTKFNKLADKENFVVVYPDAINKNWSDGRIGEKLPMDRDDVKFTSSLIDSLRDKYNIDTNFVFATGISNGGFFSIYLAYKLSKRILAVAPVTANLPENYANDFKMEYPVSLLLINGTEDPLVKYDGGFVGFRDDGERGKSVSTDETIRLWMKGNDCMTSRKMEDLVNKNINDGCTAKKYTYYKCKDRTRVSLIRIDGGGHTWPGGAQYLPKLIVGNVCKDFKATEVIWEFFKKQMQGIEDEENEN